MMLLAQKNVSIWIKTYLSCDFEKIFCTQSTLFWGIYPNLFFPRSSPPFAPLPQLYGLRVFLPFHFLLTFHFSLASSLIFLISSSLLSNLWFFLCISSLIFKFSSSTPCMVFLALSSIRTSAGYIFIPNLVIYIISSFEKLKHKIKNDGLVCKTNKQVESSEFRIKLILY